MAQISKHEWGNKKKTDTVYLTPLQVEEKFIYYRKIGFKASPF
jgi:hypothetical protein